jgi:predicted HTH domain antitoxin
MNMITTEGLVKAGLYPDEQSVVQEALRVLWQERPQLRIEWALYLYQTEDISLSKAAALANVSFDRMKEIFIKRGIQPRLGTETIEEACDEMKAVDQVLEHAK